MLALEASTIHVRPAAVLQCFKTSTEPTNSTDARLQIEPHSKRITAVAPVVRAPGFDVGGSSDLASLPAQIVTGAAAAPLEHIEHCPTLAPTGHTVSSWTGAQHAHGQPKQLVEPTQAQKSATAVRVERFTPTPAGAVTPIQETSRTEQAPAEQAPAVTVRVERIIPMPDGAAVQASAPPRGLPDGEPAAPPSSKPPAARPVRGGGRVQYRPESPASDPDGNDSSELTSDKEDEPSEGKPPARARVNVPAFSRMISLPQGTGEPQIDQPGLDGAEPNGVERGLAKKSAKGVADNPRGDAERAEVKRLQEQWKKEKQKWEELMARAQGMTQGQLWEWTKKTRNEIGSGWTRQDEQRLEKERLNEFFNADSKQKTNDEITYKS
jgi:hypothetical protein